jgi:hypothetical protein
VIETVDAPLDVIALPDVAPLPDVVAVPDVVVLDEPLDAPPPDPDPVPEPVWPPANCTGRQPAVAATAAASSPTTITPRRFLRSITGPKIVPPGSFSGCPAGVVASDSPGLRVP